MNMIVNTSDLVGYEAENTASKAMQRKKALSVLLEKWGLAQSRNAKKIAGFGFLAVSLAACNSDDDDSADSDLAAQLAAANAAVAAAQAAQAAAETAQAAAEAANTESAASAVTALTTNIDTVTPADSGDQVSAGLTGTAQTLQSMDVVNMGGGADTINAIVNTSVVPQLTDVETVNLSATTAVVTVNMAGSTGYTDIHNTGSTTALTVSNIALGTGINVANGSAGGTFTYASTTGTSDSATLGLSNVTGGTYTIAGIENLTINSTGPVSNTATMTIANTSNLTLTGDKSLTLGTNTTSTTVDASGSTGAVIMTSATTAALTYTGSTSIDTLTVGTNAVAETINLGAGNDKVTFTANMLVTDVVDGGDGTDTLVSTMAIMDVLDASGTANMNVSNMEVLEVSDDLANTLTTQNVQAGIASVHLAEGGTGTVIGPAGDLTVTIGNPLTGTVTLTDTGTGTTDSVSISSSSLTAEAWAANQAVTTSGYETLNISTTTPSGTATDQQFGIITVGSDTGGSGKLVITGSSKIDLTGAPTGMLEIDASGMTANATTTTYLTYDDNGNRPVSSGTTMTITGSPGRDTISGDTDATNTISGGDGADTLTGGTGNDTINGGAGNDTIDASDGNPATGGDTITGGAGDDTITFGAQFYITAADTDSIDGGDGTDTLSLTTAGVALVDAYSVSVANALNAGMSNMEKLSISDQLNTGVDLDMARLDGINDVTLVDGIDGNESLIGMTSGATVTANADNAADTDILTISLANSAGTADVVNYNMVQAATDDYGVVALSAIETINVSATEATANATVRVATLGMNITTSTSGTTLNVSGTESVTIDTVIAANTITSTTTGVFNMSNATGSNLAQTITSGAGADTLNGGGGADVMNSGAAGDTVNGGAGADTITPGEGTDTVNGGAGSDSIILTETTAAKDITILDYSNRGSDVDTITGFSTSTDEIQLDISELVGAGGGGAFANGDAAVELFDGAAQAAAQATLHEPTAASTVVDSAEVVVLVGSTFATSSDVEDALEVGGTFALTVSNTATDVGDSFFVVYTNGTDAKVALARATVETAVDTDFEAGDLTVFDLATISGISAIAATTFAPANFEII